MLGDIDGPEKAYRIMDSYFTVKMLQHVLQTDGQGERIEPRLGGATGDMSNSIFMRACVSDRQKQMVTKRTRERR